MNTERKGMLIGGLGLAGNVIGIIVAVNRKSGFWGGVGWFLLGGIAGAAIGWTAAAIIPDSGNSASENTNKASMATDAQIRDMMDAANISGYDVFDKATSDEVKARFKNLSGSAAERLTILIKKTEPLWTPAEKTEFQTIWMTATGEDIRS